MSNRLKDWIGFNDGNCDYVTIQTHVSLLGVIKIITKSTNMYNNEQK